MTRWLRGKNSSVVNGNSRFEERASGQKKSPEIVVGSQSLGLFLLTPFCHFCLLDSFSFVPLMQHTFLPFPALLRWKSAIISLPCIDLNIARISSRASGGPLLAPDVCCVLCEKAKFRRVRFPGLAHGISISGGSAT